MTDKFNEIPHNSMKINADNIITFTIKSNKKMSQKSMQNLTRKKGAGVLSKRSMYEIENTLLNFFQHVKTQNKKEKFAEQSTPVNAPYGRTSGVQTFCTIKKSSRSSIK
jgi:hypothetical protein